MAMAEGEDVENFQLQGEKCWLETRVLYGSGMKQHEVNILVIFYSLNAFLRYSESDELIFSSSLFQNRSRSAYSDRLKNRMFLRSVAARGPHFHVSLA